MRDLFRRIEPYLTPLVAFAGLFFVSMIVLSLALGAVTGGRSSLELNHLVSLLSVIIASAICVLALERGRWDLGIFVSRGRALRGLARGLLVALLVVGVTDVVILTASDYRHVIGEGINWQLVLTLILPAAFGEELLFRGYVLQKLYRTNRGYAVLVTSLLFAVAHGGNPAIGLVSFANILLAGILLALLWVWDRSLWAPTWGHVAWNVVSGPVLGHELSGLDLGPTLLEEVDPGPVWLTGGDFGIEASVVLTMMLVLAIWFIVLRIRSEGDALGKEALETASVSNLTPDSLSGTSHNQIDEVDSQ